MKKRIKTDKPLVSLVISLLVVLALAFILSSFFYRFDLTSGKTVYTFIIQQKITSRSEKSSSW